MTELIKIVLAKPKWQEKIDDPLIVGTWLDEIAAQGISKQVFECMLDLLRSYRNVSKTQYDQDSEFPWDVKLGVTMEEVGFECECPCACCSDGYNMSDEDDDDDESNEGSQDSDADRRKMQCLCTDDKRIALFQKFVDKFVLCSQFNDSTLKRSFLSEIAVFERSIVSVDYHPGDISTQQDDLQYYCVTMNCKRNHLTYRIYGRKKSD